MKSPCPLMSAETDRGITFSSLATAPLPPIRLGGGAVGAVRAVGVRVVVSGSVVSPCIIPETLALSETLMLLRGGVVLLWLQKVMRKPEIHLQSAETLALGGTLSAFAVKRNLRCSSRSSSLLTRPFEISSLSALSVCCGTWSVFRAWSN